VQLKMLIKLRKKSKAQTTAEYAILLGLVIAAAVAMQVYVKRGIQARIHDAARSLVNQTSALDAGQADGLNLQYEPYYQNSAYVVNRGSNGTMTQSVGGNLSGNETSSVNRTGNTTYGFTNADATQ
jgi:uncharacterized protein (UPF0333 family)